jgi:hypothetical protein
MALIDNAEQALSILGQATEEYKGTRKDHAYIEAALEFIKSALVPQEDVESTE